MCCPGNTRTKPFNLGEDGLGGGGPHERRGIGVVMLNKALDLRHQRFDAGERSAPNRLLGDDAKPALDLVELRGIGWCVVAVVARAPGQPGFDLGMLLGGVVVDDEMDIELRPHIGIEMA